jgi:alcohol dehydrogenase
MIDPFRNHLPVKIRFGDGVAGQLAAVLADEGASRPFLIMDRGLDVFVPGVAAAIAPLDGAVRFEKDAGEPTAELVEQAAEALSASGCDAVVALGGGSSMDTAKAARLVAAQGGPYMRFARGEATY